MGNDDDILSSVVKSCNMSSLIILPRNMTTDSEGVYQYISMPTGGQVCGIPGHWMSRFLNHVSGMHLLF